MKPSDCKIKLAPGTVTYSEQASTGYRIVVISLADHTPKVLAYYEQLIPRYERSPMSLYENEIAEFITDARNVSHIPQPDPA